MTGKIRRGSIRLQHSFQLEPYNQSKQQCEASTVVLQSKANGELGNTSWEWLRVAIESTTHIPGGPPVEQGSYGQEARRRRKLSARLGAYRVDRRIDLRPANAGRPYHELVMLLWLRDCVELLPFRKGSLPLWPRMKSIRDASKSTYTNSFDEGVVPRPSAASIVPPSRTGVIGSRDLSLSSLAHAGLTSHSTQRTRCQVPVLVPLYGPRPYHHICVLSDLSVVSYGGVERFAYGEGCFELLALWAFSASRRVRRLATYHIECNDGERWYCFIWQNSGCMSMVIFYASKFRVELLVL